MDNIIISRFRPTYWVRKLIEYCGGIIIVAICLSFSIDEGTVDYRNILFWIGSLGIVAFTVYVSHFLFCELKILNVTDTSINVKYLLTKRLEQVSFNDIRSLTERRIRHRRGFGMSDGYYEFKIEFSNGEFLVFDQDQHDIKGLKILEYR